MLVIPGLNGATSMKNFYQIGVAVKQQGKMPDVIIYYREKNWLILAEAVTSSGPIDGIRHNELLELFKEQQSRTCICNSIPKSQYNYA